MLNMEFKDFFVRRVAQLRKKKTHVVLAAGGSKGSATQWSDGTSKPSRQILRGLARELEVSHEILNLAIDDKIDESFFQSGEGAYVAEGSPEYSTPAGPDSGFYKLTCLNDDLEIMLPPQISPAGSVLFRYDFSDFDTISPGDYLVIDTTQNKPVYPYLYLFKDAEGEYTLLHYRRKPIGGKWVYFLGTDKEKDQEELGMTQEEATELLVNMECVGRPIRKLSKDL